MESKLLDFNLFESAEKLAIKIKKKTNRFIKFENIQMDLRVSNLLLHSKIDVPIDRESGLVVGRKSDFVMINFINVFFM